MDAREALKLTIDMGKMISLGYLGDLTDAEMMKRPCPGCNHIIWQIGHLLVSEHGMMTELFPNSMPPLPDGFAEKYTKDSAKSDNPADFDTKAELLPLFEKIRSVTLELLSKVSDSDLDKPTGVDYAPTMGAMFELQGSHWLMHCGQWAVVRRQCGRPPLF